MTSLTLLFKVISVIRDPLNMQQNLRTLVQSIFKWTDQHPESHVLSDLIKYILNRPYLDYELCSCC